MPSDYGRLRMTRFISTATAVGFLAGCLPSDQWDQLPPDGASTEIWRCYEENYGSDWPGRLLVKLTANHETGLGSVEVQGLPAQATHFMVQGVERAWAWDIRSSDGVYNYIFLIGPDGWGKYVDFRSGEPTAKPTDIYTDCRRNPVIRRG